MESDYRIGHGLDVHRFGRGRKLILGGIEIPHHSGLLGHSDADVVVHALMNAILGALGKEDIGVHFPDSDRRYEGIRSGVLLRRVVTMMKNSGFVIVNADLTVLAEEPRLAPFYSPMRKNLARLAEIAEECINVKAGTTEKLGWVGQAKGMMATAVVLLRKSRRRKRHRKRRNS